MAKKPSRRFYRQIGKKGGQTRAKRLSPLARSLSAQKAAQARWQKDPNGR